MISSPYKTVLRTMYMVQYDEHKTRVAHFLYKGRKCKRVASSATQYPGNNVPVRPPSNTVRAEVLLSTSSASIIII